MSDDKNKIALARKEAIELVKEVFELGYWTAKNEKTHDRDIQKSMEFVLSRGRLARDELIEAFVQASTFSDSDDESECKEF
jgi:hypothetical protein